MATRENQALQISLIIFVMLTMACAFVAYLGFKNYQEEQLKVKDLEKVKLAHDGESKKLKDEIEELRKMLGYTSESELATIQEEYAKNMKDYAVTAAKADDKNYRFLVPYYSQALNRKSAEVEVAKEESSQLAEKIQTLTVANKGEVDKFHEATAATGKDLMSEKEKFTTDRAAISANKDQLAGNKDKAEKDLNTEKEKNRLEMARLMGELAKAKQTAVDTNKKFKDLTQPAIEQPQGKITWVSQIDRNVSINLGQQDGLRKQITFIVYDATSTSIGKDDAKKGTVEVIQIDGSHTAIARIVEDNPKNPLMPGDVIYTKVWQPGYTEHFALVGFFDIDGDGRSDRQKIHDLIIANSGVVDAEMDEKGEVIGTLDLNTHYIVIGERPTDKTDPKVLKSFTTMITKATDLGVQQMPIHRFLSFVGYTPERSGGAKSSGAAFIEKKDKDADPGFRPRNPGKAAGAFDK